MQSRLLLMAHFKGQIVMPDFGFYGWDCHVSLIREGRLIVGVNFLGESPVKLREAALLMDEKVPSGTTLQDAETLAEYAGLVRGTIGFTGFVQRWSKIRPVRPFPDRTFHMQRQNLDRAT